MESKLSSYYIEEDVYWAITKKNEPLFVHRLKFPESDFFWLNNNFKCEKRMVVTLFKVYG